MSRSLLRLCLLTGACLAAAAAMPALAGTTYLNWANKSPVQATAQASVPAPAPVVTTATGSYTVPPSPYGQVGDPYVHPLNWSNRYGPAPQAPVQQASQPAPVQQVASLTPPPRQPVPAAAPPQAPQRAQPVRNTGRYVDSTPAPRQIEPEDDAYEGVPDMTAPPVSPVAQRDLPPPPAKMTEGSAPARPAPQAPVAPAQTADDDGGYQVPANSPYAARIAAARKAQGDAAQAAAQAPAPPAARPAPAQAPVVATAPEPAEPLSADATDHVFIPGEHYTSAADEPRFYSLHREYGYRPDPITSDPNATGALLEPLNDVRTGDDQAKDDADSDDSSAGDDDARSDKDTSDTDTTTSP